MRFSKTTLWTTLLVCLIGFQLISINVQPVRSTTDISVVNPATGNNQFTFYTNTTPVGFKFNATIWVSGYGAPPVMAWQVKLFCNFTFVRITRAWNAFTDPAYIFVGKQSFPQATIGLNWVLFGDTLLGNQTATPPPEPAKLATVEFEIMAAPVSQNLFLSLDINNVDTYLLDQNLAEIPYVTKTSGQYAYINPNIKEKMPSTISINVNPNTVMTGDNVTISGTITPIRPNAPVTIYAKPIASDLLIIADVQTDSASSYIFVWKPMKAAAYLIYSSWVGDENTLGATSPHVALTVNSQGPPPPPPPKSQTVSVVNPLTGDNRFVSDMGQFYIGYRFNATIWTYNITDLFAYQVHLTVDDTLLNITGAWILNSSQWVFYGKTTLNPPPFLYDVDKDGSNEAVVMGSTILDEESPTFSGTGLLAIVGFEVIRVLGKYETLTCSLDINNADTYLLDSNLDVINITKESGYYEFTWPAPGPETTITVINPSTGNSQFIFFTNTTHVGDRFNATVWVSSAIDAASWQVYLTYKPDLLNATRAWIPSSDPEYIFYGKNTLIPPVALFNGSVQMGDVTIPYTGVSFSTPKKLGTIEFQILLAPADKETVVSNLAINNMNTYLLDPQLNEISALKMNGYYQYVGPGGTPSGPTQVLVVPPQLTVGSPDLPLPTPPFTVDVFVFNVSDLYAWQVKIYYNPGTLNFTSAIIPPGHVFDGEEFVASPVLVRADEFGTYIMLGATLLGDRTGFSGSGVLCQLTFIGTTAGNSFLSFSMKQDETTLLDSQLTVIPFDVVDGIVTVLGVPPPPPPPPKNPSEITLYASPTDVIAGQQVFLKGTIVYPWKPYTDVMIFIRPVNGTWLLLNTVQTDQFSQFSYMWTTDTPGWFELKSAWSGDEFTLPAESLPQLVHVEPKPAHDLTVSLIAPDYTLPDAPTALDVMVYNLGASVETNVQVQLFIEGVLVTSQTVPTLASDGTYTLHYVWKPQTEARYNVTAYVPSVPGESNTANNKVTAFITVAKPLIHPSEGQWAMYNISIYGISGNYTPPTMTWNLTYAKYISPALINVTLTSSQIVPPGVSPSGWMILNIVTRLVEKDSGIYWAGMWYPGWIQTNITIGSTVRLLTLDAAVTGSEVIEAAGRKIDCWKLNITAPGYPMNYTFWYDKTTGLWIAMEIVPPISPPVKETLILVATNIPIGSALKVQTDKAMYVQNETATIQATYKIGDTPVENADVLVEVDYPDGTLWFTWTMTTDANGYASVSFVIPNFAPPYGTYMVYATAYKTGMPPASATTTFRVVHYQAELTLWFEGSDIRLINQNATIALHVKNIGNLTAQQVTVEFSVPTDAGLQVFVAHTNYLGVIAPGQEVTLTAIVTSSRPNRYSFDAMAKYTWEGSIMMVIAQAHKTLVYTYHLDYPVDLLNMTVTVTESSITVSLIVANYGDSPVEVTLIASAQQTAIGLMLGSVYHKITIDPGETSMFTMTITISVTPAQGEYEVQGILATGLPHEGGFPLTHREQTITV